MQHLASAVALALLLAGCAASEAAPRVACDASSDEPIAATSSSTPASDGPLVCRPRGAPPPPDADEACRGKQAGALCSVAFAGAATHGTCL